LRILKKSPLLLTAVLIGVTLTGCSSGVTLACDPAGAGSEIESIEVSTGPLSKPTVSFPSPITADSIQSRIISEGNGNVFTGRNLIEIEFAQYNGGTGVLLQESAFDGVNPSPASFGPKTSPKFCSALVGAKEGSRVAVLFPAQDAHEGKGVPESDIAPTDSIVFVFDVVRVYLEKAQGSAVAPQTGLPTVVTTPEGIPGITIPKTQAPTELRIAQLIKGSGPTVQPGDQVTVHYSGFLWDDGYKFDSSWETERVFRFINSPQSELIKGYLAAIQDQPVGSQVLVVIPPEFGYGEQQYGFIPPGSTLIFVIDILGTSSN
jgi:peptidylprolyl isomerase